MGLFDFLKTKKNTASIAKERLRIIVAQERSSRGAPDYLPLLQRELLEVIRKYVSVDVDARYTLTDADQVTRVGWTPFASREVFGRIERVTLRGQEVYAHGSVLAAPGSGRVLFQ